MSFEHPRQKYINRRLNRAVVFSIYWLAGFGSAYSVFVAREAHREIRASDGVLGGLKRVYWCYLVGGAGVLLMTAVLTAIFTQGFTFGR